MKAVTVQSWDAVWKLRLYGNMSQFLQETIPRCRSSYGEWMSIDAGIDAWDKQLTNKQERLKCLKWQSHCAGTTRVEVTGRTAWKGDSSSGYSRQTAMERRWHDAADCSRHGQQRPETLGRRQSTTVYGEWTMTMPNEAVSCMVVRSAGWRNLSARYDGAIPLRHL